MKFFLSLPTPSPLGDPTWPGAGLSARTAPRAWAPPRGAQGAGASQAPAGGLRRSSDAAWGAAALRVPTTNLSLVQMREGEDRQLQPILYSNWGWSVVFLAEAGRAPLYLLSRALCLGHIDS